jgi:CRISPR/Cas system CMR subunit Cmr4 (Cas7 group RAMP superfamily)
MNYKDEVREKLLKQIKELSLNGNLKINGDKIFVFSEECETLEEAWNQFKKDQNLLRNQKMWIDYNQTEVPDKDTFQYQLVVDILQSIE